MFDIKNPKKSFYVSFPTSIEEVTKDYFDSLLGDIKLQEHYCIVALCFKEKLSNLALNVRDRRNTTSNVTPIIAKIAEDNDCHYKQMDIAVVDRTNLERGIHLPMNHNWIGVAGFERYIDNNLNLINQLANGTYWKEISKTTPEIILVEFKILPIRDIVAVRGNNVPSCCLYAHKLDAEEVVN